MSFYQLLLLGILLPAAMAVACIYALPIFKGVLCVQSCKRAQYCCMPQCLLAANTAPRDVTRHLLGTNAALHTVAGTLVRAIAAYHTPKALVFQQYSYCLTLVCLLCCAGSVSD
jgi:hypothetical protein